jgi:hypothetical protein
MGQTLSKAVTHKQELAEKRLSVNVRVKAGGEMRVELLDESGRAIPGFTAKDCQPITGDHRRTTVQWKNGEMAPTNGVKTRFELRRAFLYGYEWNERTN